MMFIYNFANFKNALPLALQRSQENVNVLVSENPAWTIKKYAVFPSVIF